MAERPEIRLIREALEGVLARDATHRVLFDALSRFGSHVPRTPDEMMLLVRGPLHEVLAKRIGAEQARPLVEKMAVALRALPGPGPGGAADSAEGPGTQPLPLVDVPVKFDRDERSDPSMEILIDTSSMAPGPKPRESREATVEFKQQRSAVAVMVIASGLQLEQRLAQALGPVRVAPFTVGILERFEREANHRQPPVVILDATDFPPIDAEDVAAAMSELPPTTVKAIWGIDLPYGRSVADAMRAMGSVPTFFDRAEGLDAMIDLIRSRRA